MNYCEAQQDAPSDIDEDLSDSKVLISHVVKTTGATPTTRADEDEPTEDFSPLGLESSPEPATGVVHTIERWNEDGTRGLRVTQHELSIIGGLRVVTKIEVLEDAADGGEAITIFTVKHTTSGRWRKHLHVHKNLLLACVLAGVPCPIEVPEDSLKVFRSIENPQHVHIYLERIIPHFRFKKLPPEVSAFWWRAVGHGALVFQNWLTGRLLILPCRAKGIPAAGETLKRALGMLQHMPSQFWEMDMEYHRINQAAVEEAAACPDEVYTTSERVAEAIQSWALEDGVSPWMTKLIVKARGPRRGQILQYRYSLGVDSATTNAGGSAYLTAQGEGSSSCMDGDTGSGNLGRSPAAGATEEIAPSDQLFVAVQVHCNEPLSRELKAYPICMVPVSIESFDFEALTALYLRSLWFLRKLYEYHSASECGEEVRRTAGERSSRVNFLREKDDSRDLSTRSRLVGGARLALPRFQPQPKNATPKRSSPRHHPTEESVHSADSPDNDIARNKALRSSDTARRAPNFL